MWIALWFGAILVSNIIGMAALWQMLDEIEADLPIQQRPSWRLIHQWGLPLKEIRRHREMFPSSRLRLVWTVATLVAVACAVAPFLIGFSRYWLTPEPFQNP